MENYEDDEFYMNGGAGEEDVEDPPEIGDQPEDEEEDGDVEITELIDEDEEEEVVDPNTSGDEEAEDLLEYKEHSGDDESSDEDYDSSDDEFDNRVDEEFKEQFMKSIHPEQFHDSYNFIKMMTSLERDEFNLIHDDKHVTLPILTKYEKARILGLRISQLNKGAQPYITIENHHIVDMHIIAEQELKKKKLPFIIMRPMPNGNKEYWKLEDLEIIEN